MNTLAYRPQNLKRSILSPKLCIYRSLIPRLVGCLCVTDYVAILAWDRASPFAVHALNQSHVVFMSMSIRTNFLFVMLAALAANAFASSDGCSTEDTNMLLQAQKIMRTPKDEHRSLAEWKRYRRRYGWRRQHPHGYYVPRTSTTVAETSTMVVVTTSSTSTATSTTTTSTTTSTKNPTDISCLGAISPIIAPPNVVSLPNATFTTFSANSGPPQDGCCPLQSIFQIQITPLNIIPPDEVRPVQDFQLSIKSPLSLNITQASFSRQINVAFVIPGLPATAIDGPWELDFFYPSQWQGLEVDLVRVACSPAEEWSGPVWGASGVQWRWR